MKTIDVKVTRLIPAPPNDVFDVWLDPSSPGCPWHGALKMIVDVKVDGLFFWGHDNDGTPWPHYGRFTKLERGKLAEYTWMSPSTNGLESNVSVSFEATGGGTQVTIHHSGLPDDKGGRGHERGWTYLLGELEKSIRR